MIRSVLQVICALLLAVSALPAQTLFDLARPALRTYEMGDGLPSGTIYCFARDSKGRLWAGSVDGAAYYTGRGWVPVRMPRESPSQYIRAILASRDGSLWFATQDGGLWRLHEDRWAHFRAGRDLPSDHVFSLAETQDAQGRLTRWIGTADRGITALSGDQWRAWGPKEGLPGGTVWRIREIQAPDGTRRMWAATEKGLCILEGDHWRVLGTQDGFLSGDANDVMDVPEADGSRSVWVSMFNLGLARWDGRVWTYYAAGKDFPARSPTSSLCVSRDPSGRTILWIGTLNQGLWWYRDGRWQSLGKSQGFLTAGILSLMPVPEGKPTLWIGTRGGGVASLDLGGWRTLDESLGLPGMEVTCFAETAQKPGEGAFWVGTSNGLVCFRPGRPAERVDSASLPSDYIIALLPTGSELWVATLKGLARRDASGWHRVDGNGVPPEGMVICLLETRSRKGGRTLWVGTPNGLACLEQGRWRLMTRRDGLPQDFISSLYAVPGTDGEPVLWVGTRGGGVCRFERGVWTAFGADAGIPNGNVYALHATAGPTGHRWLWAGTLGGGMARLDLQAPSRWEVFTRESLPGLTSNYIQRIEEDVQGRLYLSTSTGVTRLHLDWAGGTPRPARLDSFTLGDGLPSQNGSLGASYVDTKGRVWIGTSRGATVLDPAQETFPPTPPPPVLERVTVANPERTVASGQRLGFRDQYLRFEFSLPVFHRKEDTRYQTQLMGLEPEPRPWHPEAWREFATLPSGSYTLRIWARTFDGKVSGPVEFPFQVAPAPWLHPLAFAIYALALVGGILGFLRLRTRVLQERTVALGQAVRDRTQIIEQQSRALGASNLDLQQANLELTRLSSVDALTQIYNRMKLDAVLLEEMTRATRYRSVFSVILLDIDHFKKVNDTYGHLVGDAVLVRVASILSENIRKSDTLGRWGGEEFLLVLPETDLDKACLLAEKLRQAIAAETFPAVGHKTGSFGVAAYDPEDTVASLVERADQALYEAKNTGRDRVQSR
ncbi:MAG TPA: diguanylate cyclase [Geothrix sp.]|jgi:diguanylate cyclase (GGDEF)-like protein